jgi:hypothetical protein
MLRVETTIGTENRVPFSLTWAGDKRVKPDARGSQIAATRVVAARGLTLSGYQLLFGCAFLLGLAGVALWALELWLFEL